MQISNRPFEAACLYRAGVCLFAISAGMLILSASASFAVRDDKQDPKLPKAPPSKKEIARRSASAEQKRLAELAAREGVTTDWHSILGTPLSIRGKGLGRRRSFSSGKGLALKGGAAFEADAVAVVDNLTGFFGVRDAGKEFVADRTDSDTLLFHHVRLHQVHEGLRVIGGDLIVHFDKDGDACEVNGRYVPAIALKTEPKIRPVDAIASALKDISPDDAARAVASKAELVIYAMDCDPMLAYELTVSCPHGKSGPGKWRYWIDALDGTILMRFNDLKKVAAPTSNGSNATITGSLLSGEGGTAVSVTGWFENTGIYYLYNKIRHWYVYNVATSGWTDRSTYAYRSTADWGTSDRAEMSAARSLDLVQDYYLQTHGRNSYDGSGAMAIGKVHEGNNYVNAYWDGTAIYLGDGDGVEANSLAVLDIIGHELTHAVTENAANLNYINESGALNESYSDIFGACVEFHSQPDGTSLYPNTTPGTADWLLGEDCWISSKSLRDMRSPSNPLTVGAGNEQPSRYKGTYWYYGTGDNGGVHQNSGVQNFLFYLVSQGGSGVNDGFSYTVTGIGVTNAEKVAYRALTVYCTPSTDYEGDRAAWMSAAADLNTGWTGTVAAAWNAVGVSPGMATVAKPAFSPAEGAYASSVTVTVTTATAGATIYYTTDGGEPTESSTVYTTPVVISVDTTLKAKAFNPGMLPSQTASGRYMILGAKICDFPMDSSPGWSVQGAWAFGQPAGSGGEHGSPDPTSGHTGLNVYGYNLAGDYANSIGTTYWLTTTAMDLSMAANTKLLFWRWLGVERPAYDHAYVEVSVNGTTWTRIWENSTEIADSQWALQMFDISAVADQQSTFYVRWGIGPTDSSYRYCGWNIDDVSVWGDIVASSPPAAPTNLAASAISGTTVWLRWDDQSNNEQGFAIERRTGAGAWSEIARVGANSTSTQDTNAVPSLTYTYRVMAFNPAGDSDYSNESTVTTPSGSGDSWDPGDDSGSGATFIPAPTTPVQSHGPHTLSATDLADWFSVDLTAGFAYNFNSAGGSGDTYAELYTDQAGLQRVGFDDDSGANLQFSLSYSPTNSGQYYLRVQTYSPGSEAFYLLNYTLVGSIGDAVDATKLPWTTGGAANWFSQSAVNHDGRNAAQSGPIGDSAQSWMQTTVAGPGNLSFWWRVSSEAGYDGLRFYIDGTEQPGSISGLSTWLQKTYAIPAGSHTLKWAYTKDSTQAAGFDCGWVDQVTFTSFIDLTKLHWQLSSGQATAWALSTNGLYTGSMSVSTAVTTWQIKAAADIDRDNVADLIWQLPSGQAACWLMNADGTRKSVTNIYTGTTTWQIKAAGDIDGDGVADLIWQLPTGQAACWFMNAGGSLKSTASIYSGATSWQIKAAGDIDGNTIADLVWQLPTGQTACWFMNAGGSLKSTASIYSGATSWQVRSAGKVNTDSVADIVLQLPTGQAAYWFMNSNGSIRSASYLSQAASAWIVRAIGK